MVTDFQRSAAWGVAALAIVVLLGFGTAKAIADTTATSTASASATSTAASATSTSATSQAVATASPASTSTTTATSTGLQATSTPSASGTTTPSVASSTPVAASPSTTVAGSSTPATSAPPTQITMVASSSVPLVAVILKCSSAYTADLYNTPSGHLDPGYYLNSLPATSTSGIIAQRVGSQSWLVCHDRQGAAHEIAITLQAYANLALPGATIPQASVLEPAAQAQQDSF